MTTTPLPTRALPQVIGFLTLLALASCATQGRLVTFSSQEPGSELTLVPMNNPESVGTRLRNPVTMPMDRLEGKAIRFSANGKAPEYWFTPNEAGRRVSIRVNQLHSCPSPTGDGNLNRPVRMLMKAYQALTSDDYNLARALAQKAAEMDTSLAAPYIISGMASYYQGKKEEARVAFSKAKALDPEDDGIQELLKMAQ